MKKESVAMSRPRAIILRTCDSFGCHSRWAKNKHEVSRYPLPITISNTASGIGFLVKEMSKEMKTAKPITILINCCSCSLSGRFLSRDLTHSRTECCVPEFDRWGAARLPLTLACPPRTIASRVSDRSFSREADGHRRTDPFLALKIKFTAMLLH